MFRRKEKPRRTVQDRNYRELWRDALTAKTRLKQKAQDVLVKKMAVELYPDGPDKKRAEEDLSVTKRGLLSAIGYYEERVREMIDYRRNNTNVITDIERYNPSIFDGSHQIVEQVCKTCLFRE